MKLQRVLLSRIDITADGWDNFIFDLNPSNIDRMAESFERIGQVYPLILLKYMDWLFIIAGYARYLAMRKLNVDETWARIFQENEVSKEECLWLAVEARSSSPFNSAAQRRVLGRFHKIAGYSEERLATEVAPAIGLNLTVDEVREILVEDDE